MKYRHMVEVTGVRRSVIVARGDARTWRGQWIMWTRWRIGRMWFYHPETRKMAGYWSGVPF